MNCPTYTTNKGLQIGGANPSVVETTEAPTSVLSDEVEEITESEPQAPKKAVKTAKKKPTVKRKK